MNYRGFLLSTACAVGFIAGPAFAQDAAAPEGAVEEVVVTGTLVRGVAPIGSAVSTVGQEDIQRVGVTSTNQILANIPQMANAFNNLTNTPTAAKGATTYRPNMRQLPPSGNNNTLILVDGHNIIGAGITQNSPDIGALPAGAIERVEVVLDGGSATYGSDAVGGTLNFITRSHFNGVSIDGNTGAAADTYRSYSLNLTAGRDWDGGGVVLAISTRQNNALQNSERELPRQDLTPYGFADYRVRQCNPGNIIVGTATYALPNRAPGTLNLCDNSLLGVTTPAERQTGGYLSVTHRLSDTLKFDLRAFGSKRVTRTQTAQLVETGAVINGTNPFFQRIGNETQHSVAFSWAPVLGPYSYTQVALEFYDIAPTLTWEMGGGWQTKMLAEYGWSRTVQDIPQINTAASLAALRGAGLTTATALNPYNLTATNPAVLQAITNYSSHGYNNQNMTTIRAIADGPLFTLPGGEVRAAIGGQFQRIAKDGLTVVGPVGSEVGAITDERSRKIYAVFGELVVPIIGDGNALPLVQSFDVTLSARYDKYEAVGDTANPKIGATWKVNDDLSLRGNWGTAFIAPSVQETIVAGTDAQVQIQNSTALRTGDAASNSSRPTILVSGGQPGIKPEDAETWSVGFDYNPSALPGLSLTSTYWSIYMTDIIQTGCTQSLREQLNKPALDGSCYYYMPSLATALSLTDGYRNIVGNATSVAQLYGAGNDPYVLQDRRKRNYGDFRTTGLDFRVAYRHPTDWGAVYGSVSGTKFLTRDQQDTPGGAWIDLLAANTSDFNVQGILGIDVERFTATATVRYSSAYDVTGIPLQTEIDAFKPLNLFFRYEFENDLALTLNVDNVFDDLGDVINQSGGTTASTLGRFIQVGFKKAF